HDARLAALENYMKELHDEIHKKDERITELESQLRMVKVWTDEFVGSVEAKLGADNSVEDQTQNTSSAGLHKQLTRLQSRIENGFRALEANAHELRIKAQDEEMAKNKALEFAATTLANSSAVVVQAVTPQRASPQPQQSLHQRQQQSSPTSGSRVRNPFSRSKTLLNEHPSQHSSNNNSDLNMVLNESLLELDLQISLDHQNQSSSSPSSSSSYSNNNASTASTPDSNSHGRLSRNNSENHWSKQRHELNQRTSRSRQRQADAQESLEHHQQPKDELVVGDAHEEIKRLNAMVDELERLVRIKMQ
ncbi:hypothetical protein BGZ70_000562, partial [Mortierella alpina]